MNDKEMGALPVGAMSTIDGFAQYGITLRQHYAGLAMQGFSANPECTQDDVSLVAKAAVMQADALLAALSEPHP